MAKSVGYKNFNGDLVLVAVTIGWLVSLIYDIASPAYETSPFIHGLMGAIVGFFYKPAKKADETPTT